MGVDTSVRSSVKQLVCVYLLCGILAGCWPVRSKSDVIGYYELGSGRTKISLDIKPGEVYEETVTIGGTIVDRRDGKWRWGPKFVDFDSLWIPKEFAPAYIIQADAASARGEPKYTEPGHWSLGAEKHFGRVVLMVFADVNFTMVRRGTN